MKISKNKKIDYKLELSQEEYQMLLFCISYTMRDLREREKNNVMRPKDLSFYPGGKKEVLVNSDEIFKLKEILRNEYEET